MLELDTVEQQEIFDKLREKGFGELIDAFLLNERECYTSRGRLKKVGVCRVTGWPIRQLEEQLAACKTALEVMI